MLAPRHRRIVLIWLLNIAAAPAAADSARLAIEGIEGTLAENVRAHLDLDDLSCDTEELALRSRLGNAGRDISRALRSLGHYHGRWKIFRERKDDCWHIRVTVTPGPPVTVTAVSVNVSGDADDDPAFSDYLANLPLREGAQLNHGDYTATKQRLERLGRNRGYFESEFSQARLNVDTRANTAGIVLDYQSGPRYRFGEVNFQGSSLNETFLDRFSTFEAGEPYNTDRLIALQRHLRESQYFSRIAVDQAAPDRENHRVDIQVDLADKSPYLTKLGVGASTDTGPRVNATTTNRRVNRRGHTFEVNGQWSPVQSHAMFQYRIPGNRPLTEEILFGAGVQREDTETSESTSRHLEAQYTSQVWNDWLQTLSLRFIHEQFDVGGDSRTSRLLLPGVTWTRTEANDPRYPTKGWRLRGNLRGAAEGLLSDTSFVQASVDAKAILPLGGGRVIGRTSAGATSVTDFTVLPATLRFFAGGDNSVRGFDYESLGPQNADGDVVGGKYLITGSLEYDYPVWDKFSAAVFMDAGNAFDTDQFRLRRSAGLGLRWHSPIGPVRVDFAFPLDEGGFRLHLSMGPDL